MINKPDVTIIIPAYNEEKGIANVITQLKKASVLDLLLDMLDITDVNIEVKQDPERMRPSDVEILLCDCSKFRQRTGWKPKIAFEDTMGDLQDYWRWLV